MSPPSSSTSSSDGAAKRSRREIAAVGLWTAAWLVLIDVAINFAFAYPKDPRALKPGPMRLYFEYGRSIEGKLSRIVGPADDRSAPIATAGWLEPQVKSKPRGTRRPGDGHVIAFYGMSFTNHVAEAMKAIDPAIELRLFGGPGAPASHSYANFRQNRGVDADVVVLGVLASSVVGLATNNWMTWQSEAPAPYTYPRYRLEGERLTADWPTVRSLADLRACRDDPGRWGQFVAQLRIQDDFYDPFVFRGGVSDASSLVRLARRAWAQQHKASVTRRFHTDSGFDPDCELIAVLRAIALTFATEVRAEGKLPLVLLLDDRGYADHLDRVLKPALGKAGVPCVSTFDVCPATDLSHYLPDGHFTKAANRKIAGAMWDAIRKESGALVKLSSTRHPPAGKRNQ